MTAHELTIDIPRAWWLTSNQREHYRPRATKTAELRALALSTAMRADLVRGLTRVRIIAHLTYPDRRRRDPNNSAPTTKALVDGIVTDYGLCADDDYQHLIGPDHRFAGVTPGRYTVRLVVEDLGASTLHEPLRVRTVDAYAQQRGL
jgi:crossover junction endodeoxyribonuclease RusA